MITDREAKRIAIKNIATIITADLDSAEGYWQTHPDTNAPLSAAELARVEREARLVITVLERRAGRLRSVRSGKS